MAMGVQFAAIDLAERCTASGGQDNALRNTQLSDDLRLDVPERALAFLLEKAANGSRDALFDDRVSVDEPAPQSPPQVTTYRGLAAARKSDQCDIAFLGHKQ